ncbi:DUF2857 domain-containing protein [Klebsiella pneumoniae]|nr:DUF2857 domain-containing protein [Salmonella enterica]ECJ5866676.1 DUF2857 domain-containing protein [Salmonella enterica subsp. salamae]ELI6861944.1 DUF2857 domain-containing protein [Salmonella enterica]
MTAMINQFILTHVIHALREGNVRYCETLGFGPQELCELSQLSMEDVLYLSQSAASFMNITVHHDVLAKMLAQVRQEQQFRQLLSRVIQLGASIAMINHYFGLSAAEVSARRRLYGLSIPQGRNQIPDEQTDHTAWQRWKEVEVENLDSREALEAMMQVAEEQDLSLTVVWNLVKQWRAS